MWGWAPLRVTGRRGAGLAAARPPCATCPDSPGRPRRAPACANLSRGQACA